MALSLSKSAWLADAAAHLSDTVLAEMGVQLPAIKVSPIMPDVEGDSVTVEKDGYFKIYVGVTCSYAACAHLLHEFCHIIHGTWHDTHFDSTATLMGLHGIEPRLRLFSWGWVATDIFVHRAGPYDLDLTEPKTLSWAPWDSITVDNYRVYANTVDVLTNGRPRDPLGAQMVPGERLFRRGKD